MYKIQIRGEVTDKLLKKFLPKSVNDKMHEPHKLLCSFFDSVPTEITQIRVQLSLLSRFVFMSI